MDSRIDLTEHRDFGSNDNMFRLDRTSKKLIQERINKHIEEVLGYRKIIKNNLGRLKVSFYSDDSPTCECCGRKIIGNSIVCSNCDLLIEADSCMGKLFKKKEIISVL